MRRTGTKSNEPPPRETVRPCLGIEPSKASLAIGDQRFPFLRTVEAANATATLAEYVAEATHGPIVVTQRGRPVAFLARVRGMDLEDLSINTDPEFIGMLGRLREARKTSRLIPFEEVFAKWGRPAGKPRKGPSG